MAILEIILTKHSGDFNHAEKSISLEWLVFSDEISDFSLSIYQQGLLDFGENLIDSDWNALGWARTGAAYQFGSEVAPGLYAQGASVFDREIIQGVNSLSVKMEEGTPVIVDVPPDGVVRWHVSQKFSNQANKAVSQSATSTDDKIKISMSVENETEPFIRDVITGNMVVNSAGQFFNPPPEKTKKIIVYSISREIFLNPLMKAKNYSNVVNADAFYGAAPGTLLMNMTCNYDGNTWTETYEIRERLEGWETYLLDTGYEEIVGGELRKILDDDGTPVSEPAMLNGTGQKAPNGNSIGVDVGPFCKYEQLPFNALNLPNIFAIISSN
ncbi:MAG: hypothetical protein LBJ67_02885 [Planctomycetaceae bacterium]|jgi:hypothetical protein|nr:hypothetical protein [Planctomycetaceae bacterium]